MKSLQPISTTEWNYKSTLAETLINYQTIHTNDPYQKPQ